MTRVEHAPSPAPVDTIDGGPQWETRLIRLEQAHQTWKTAALGLGALLVSLAAMRGVGGLNRGGVLEAREFRLVDAQGATRAVLGLQHHGLPTLDLLDGRGEVLAMLRITDDTGAALTLRQPDSGHHVVLESSALVTQLTMIGPDNKPTISLYRHHEKTGLILSDSERTQHWSVDRGESQLARRHSQANALQTQPGSTPSSSLRKSVSGASANDTSVKPVFKWVEAPSSRLDPNPDDGTTSRRPI